MKQTCTLEQNERVKHGIKLLFFSCVGGSADVRKLPNANKERACVCVLEVLKTLIDFCLRCSDPTLWPEPYHCCILS